MAATKTISTETENTIQGAIGHRFKDLSYPENVEVWELWEQKLIETDEDGRFRRTAK